MTGTTLLPYVRVWAAAADEFSIYLVSENDQGEPDGWLAGPLVRREGEPLRTVTHRTVRELLRAKDELDAATNIHSGSWIEEDDMIVLDYLCVVGSFGIQLGDFRFVRDRWRRARPFTPKVDEELGQPPAHGATEQPDPRYFDVFRHNVGHLRQLRDTNSIVRAALDPFWSFHLDAWKPRLGGQYEYGQELRTV